MMSELLELGGMIFAVLLAIVLLIFGSVVTVDYLDCRGTASGMGVETRWSWGCYMNTDQGWLPKDQVMSGRIYEFRSGTRPVPKRTAQ